MRMCLPSCRSGAPAAMFSGHADDAIAAGRRSYNVR